MKHLSKLIFTIGLAALFCCVSSPFDGAAFGADAPSVTTLPVIREGAVTPTRMTQQPGTGKIFVTDPHAEGILVYDGVGNLLQKIKTTHEPGGIAFAKNGDLLVTQTTYVVALDPANNWAERPAHIGSFTYAFAIAVDTAGTGKIFVSDIKDYHVQVFDNAYAPVDVSAGSGHDPASAKTNTLGGDRLYWDLLGASFFNRPAGVSIEKKSGMLAVVDSLSGQIVFFDQLGNYIAAIGQSGYDASHSFLMFTYPQSIAFDYDALGNLQRAYVLDTNQSYVMVIDATLPSPYSWKWLADIGLYGHHNGDLIVPSDLLMDTTNPVNNRLLVSNGFGSISVFGLASTQPYNVTIDNIQNNSLTVNWATSTTAAFDSIQVFRSTAEGVLGTQVGGTIAKTTSSYTDNGLNQYTTYYYTVRAVSGGVPTTNIDQVSAKTTGLFSLTVSINGNGSVNGGSANVSASCTSGSCVSSQPSDALVTLTATPTGQSVFDGWTGDCFTTSDVCMITMDKVMSVNALFKGQLAFRVDGAYYDNLQDAYSKAHDGSVIKVLEGIWPSTTLSTEYMTAWQGKSVTIEGGYDATFTTNTGKSSTVIGRANLTAGKVVMKQFRLK
jgi:hypothetical protein